MQTISATYRVTTPMFLGGAEQQAELRLPSFKGMLRFWWRAMAWDRVKEVSRLRDEEAALFGSSDERVGQSKVLLRLDRNTTIAPALSPPEQLKDGTQVVGSGARYLGYGVMEAFASRKKNTLEGQLTRSCLLAPFTFTVELLLKPGTKPDQREQIEQTLIALGLFGGLGSKMPVYTGITTLAFMASLGLPGLSGFVGEALSLLGAYSKFKMLTIFSTIGIVVGAAYFLWTLQRVFLGQLNPKYADMPEINGREVVTLVPLGILTIVLGIWPAFIINMFNQAVSLLPLVP